MSKIDRDDFRETLTLLVSAHVASQTASGIRSIQDSKTMETVVEAASKITIKILDESKKYPKKKKKSKGVRTGLIALPDKVGEFAS